MIASPCNSCSIGLPYKVVIVFLGIDHVSGIITTLKLQYRHRSGFEVSFLPDNNLLTARRPPVGLSLFTASFYPCVYRVRTTERGIIPVHFRGHSPFIFGSIQCRRQHAILESFVAICQPAR